MTIEQLDENLLREVERLQQENLYLKSKLAEQAAQQQFDQVESDKVANRLLQLLELMPAGVLLIDNTGMVAECNPAAERFLGSPLQGERWSVVISRSFAPQSDDGHEISLKNGRRVQLATCALTSEPGQLVLLTDLTETRLLQSRLSHYQRLSEMGRMMASLAHQIRTPLSAALLYLNHLGKDELTSEQRSRFSSKVRSRLNNLEQQVRDMLVFARGETKLDDQVTLQQLLSELEDLLDVPLAHHEGDFEIQNSGSDVSLQCNKETLLGALVNLVENALQAGGKAVDIVIKAEHSDRQITLLIIDNGPGMDNATQIKALEPFYTTKSHGTGLGLAVAQVVAHAHHGKFQLKSIQGEGTVVSIVLPIFVQDVTRS